MADHLGYDKHDPVGRNGMNSRNGSTPKTLRTQIGEVTVQIPRDRSGTFEPAVVPKYARRLAGFDEAVISLYAKGMTTGDIVNHLSEVYGDEVSRDLVSKVTDQILNDMVDWWAKLPLCVPSTGARSRPRKRQPCGRRCASGSAGSSTGTNSTQRKSPTAGSCTAQSLKNSPPSTDIGNFHSSQTARAVAQSLSTTGSCQP